MLVGGTIFLLTMVPFQVTFVNFRGAYHLDVKGINSPRFFPKYSRAFRPPALSAELFLPVKAVKEQGEAATSNKAARSI